MTGTEYTAARPHTRAASRVQASHGRASRARAAKRARAVGVNLLGLLIALATLFPLFWMISTAFKPSHEIYSLTPSLIPTHPT